MTIERHRLQHRQVAAKASELMITKANKAKV